MRFSLTQIGIRRFSLTQQPGLPKYDALFYLDGYIKVIGGSYYFRDVSGNGRNFLITGYDFITGHVAGFPYKSKATISAPAGDTVLIAADINNFLYAAGGTPNQIHVVSLYQDVDYEHKIFTRHVAQTLNTLGVETYEPRVMDMVLYATVKSGGVLTSLQTYFGVPTEAVTNVRWITKAGNDATGTGTKLLPWLTLVKVNLSSTNNNTVYIKSGVYTENDTVFLAGSFFTNRPLNYVAVGRVEIRSTGVGNVIARWTENATFKNIVINGEDAKTACIQSYGGAKTTLWERCLFKGATASLSIGNAANIETFKYCIAIGDNTNAVQKFNTNSILIDTSYFDNAEIETLGNAVITNIRIPSNKYTCIETYGNLTLLGSDITHAAKGIDTGSSTAVPVIDIQYCNFTHEDIAGVAPNTIYVKDSVSSKVEHCRFINLVNKDGYFAYLTGQSTVQYNYLYDNNDGLFVGINVDKGAHKLNYNYAHSNTLSGTILSIGGETSVSDRNNNSEFIGNRVIGFRLENPSEAAATTHAVLITSGINIDIKYNYVSHSTLGMAVKTNAQAYTSKGVYYNLFEECGVNLWFRGIAGVKCYGNTIRQSEVVYGQPFLLGINVDENSAAAGVQESADVIIKNCILDIRPVLGVGIQFDAYAAAHGCIVENTLVYGCLNKLNDGGANYATIAAAQAAGWMPDCIDTDPQLVSLIPAVIITGAENMGTNYDDGLAITTDFGSATQHPSIVTKQQSTTWQMGAYVQ